MATNIHNVHYTDQNRSVAEILANVKDELKDFLNTRIQMLRAEMSEKGKAIASSIPAIVIGAVMLFASFFLFTGLLVTVIAQAIHNNWNYPIAFAIVFVLYALIGAAFAAYGVRTLKSAGVAPERTLRVLKQDQVWLQTEARTQL
jgi:uncharacterized membrane protein YqjE